MSKANIGNIKWGMIAQVLNIATSIALLPVIVRYFSSQEIGLWFVFTALISLAQLIEFGFQPTIVRNIAYVYSGAQRLTAKGLPSTHLKSIGGINQALLKDLILASKGIYKILAYICCTLMLIGGTIYIAIIIPSDMIIKKYIIAWIIYSCGYIMSLYYGYINCYLQGSGNYNYSNKIIVITKVIQFFLSTFLVINGFGLIGIGIAAIISGFIGRYFAIKFFERIYTRKIPNKEKSNKNRVKRIILQLWNSAKKMGIVQIGSFLLQRGSILVISSTLGLKLTAEYGITITIFSAIIGFSTVICQINLPNLSAAQIKNDKNKLSEIYGEILVVSISIYVLSASIIILIGNNLLLFIKSNSNLIPEIPLLILAIALFFEMIHGIAASYLTTLNQVPFMRAAIYSGSASFILSLILVKPMGILGIVFSQALIQALYNNWQWPKRVHKHLGIGIYELLKNSAIRLSVDILRFYKNG